MQAGYRALGRSGLVVSPLALGTMTFGAARWGTDATDSRSVFDAYVEAGGNFIDTADVYAAGGAESMIGDYIEARKLRDQLVIATKAGFAAGRPLAGGNGAGHLHRSIEQSLRRLRTDYIDLYWIHVWDSVTPAEELLETMTQLVRSGKTRYWGISNAPAWFVSKLATLAQVRGQPGPVALQYFHSLVNRDVEDELLPLAADFGMAMVPWSPLAFGLLSGKYRRADVEATGPRAAGLPRDAASANAIRADDDKRLDGANPFGDSLFTERNWQIVEALVRVAREAELPPARVALAWVLRRRGVAAVLMGASRVAQVRDNIAALDVTLTGDQMAALDTASARTAPMLYSLFTSAMRRNAVFGGAEVSAWGGSS